MKIPFSDNYLSGKLSPAKRAMQGSEISFLGTLKTKSLELMIPTNALNLIDLTTTGLNLLLLFSTYKERHHLMSPKVISKLDIAPSISNKYKSFKLN